ncbi:hypothetical protein [Roseateles chitosanitabidus]|uniref:hypothetical protein n=1 Tax=Roseateles chitosanitabidus TaxID=65048 RepID=UPI00082AC304|nr:hypothetical protein [Roseateles chitosanitabidus]MBO9687291.1 hypothetical protein [Roseateles chitosanitabidus]
MTVDVQALRRAVSPDQLIAIMVHPVPIPPDAPEIDAVVELLRNPAMLFGASSFPETEPDACCRYASWDQVADYLDVLERKRNVSVTYVRHLMHLAAYFAYRLGMRRAGPALLSVFDAEDVVSIRYELPVQLSHQEAYAQTMAFWGELAYVDLLQPPFHFHFVDQPDA